MNTTTQTKAQVHDDDDDDKVIFVILSNPFLFFLVLITWFVATVIFDGSPPPSRHHYRISTNFFPKHYELIIIIIIRLLTSKKKYSQKPSQVFTRKTFSIINSSAEWRFSLRTIQIPLLLQFVFNCLLCFGGKNVCRFILFSSSLSVFMYLCMHIFNGGDSSE